MRLTIATPLGIVTEERDVAYVRAEDETGAFGILSGHADFLTTLSVSVVTWHNHRRNHEGQDGPTDGRERHVAVRGGVLTVRGGKSVSILTREAIGEETLSALGDAVLNRMRKDEESERAARLTGTRMELAAMRQIQHYLASGSGRLYRGKGAPASSSDGADSGPEGSLP